MGVSVCAHVHVTIIIKEEKVINLRVSGGVGGLIGEEVRRQ